MDPKLISINASSTSTICSHSKKKLPVFIIIFFWNVTHYSQFTGTMTATPAPYSAGFYNYHWHLFGFSFIFLLSLCLTSWSHPWLSKLQSYLSNIPSFPSAAGLNILASSTIIPSCLPLAVVILLVVDPSVNSIRPEPWSMLKSSRNPNPAC